MGKKAKKPKGQVAMKAAPTFACSHAFCDPTSCSAGQRPKLSENDLPRRARRALTDRDVAISALRSFDLEALAFLERRAGSSSTPLEQGPGELVRDGHRPSVRYGPRGRLAARCAEEGCHERAVPGRRGCTEHSTPDDEVTDLLPPPPQGDPVGESAVANLAAVDPLPEEVERCFAELADAARIAKRAVARLGRLRRNPRLGEETRAERCEACHGKVTSLGEDRLRSGYCPACYQAWVRASRPDRRAFEVERQERAAS